MFSKSGSILANLKLQRRQFGTIFMVELWERFAFYAFSALFVLFAISLHFNEKQSFMIFGIFSALAFALPTIGGLISDHILGIKRALGLGAIILVIGYVILGLSHSIQTIYLALGLIAAGNALFKPNPTALISLIYQDTPEKTDSAFTIYYMAINLGSFFSTLFAPLIAKYTNFHVAFWIAAFGMGLSLVNYLFKYNIFSKVSNKRGQERLTLTKSLQTAVAMIVMTGVSIAMLQYSNIAFYIVVGITILCYLYLFFSGFAYKMKERILQWAGIILFIQAIVFFIVYIQMFSSLVTFAKHNLVLSVFGFGISPASIISLNPFWIIVLSPILAKLYLWLDHKKIYSNIFDKYALAMFLCAGAFFSLIIACDHFSIHHKIGIGYMVMYFFLTSMAELFISAIGLAIASKYFPIKKLSFSMGTWLLSAGAGFTLSGKISSYVAQPVHSVTKASVTLPIYVSYFHLFMYTCLSVAILFTLIALVIRKLRHKYQIKFG